MKVRWLPAEAWCAITALMHPQMPTVDAEMDLFIDVRKKIREYEKASAGKAFEDCGKFVADFTEAELGFLQRRRNQVGEKIGWPGPLVEGARGLKRHLDVLLAAPSEPPVKLTRQQRRAKARTG